MMYYVSGIPGAIIPFNKQHRVLEDCGGYYRTACGLAFPKQSGVNGSQSADHPMCDTLACRKEEVK